MRIVASGVAKIQHKTTGIVYDISPDNTDWQIVETQERSMGTETTHRAEVEHDDLGTLIFEVYEYPEGGFNSETHNLGGHKLIKDFHYGFQW